MCGVCLQVSGTAPLNSEGYAEIRYSPLKDVLARSPAIFEATFGLERFLRHFPNPAPNFSGPRACRYPDLDGSAGDWVRRYEWTERGVPHGLDVLCCPEDILCDEQHPRSHLCRKCRIPICWRCRRYIFYKHMPPPMALTNDNFIGYVSSFWARWQPKWIEMAAATPIWTSLMAFYIEEDKGHVMGEAAFAQRARVAVKGNVVSFHVQWERVFEALHQLASVKDLSALPHDENVLAELVRFEFKVASDDITHHLHDLKLRAHVVLHLGYELIEKNHPSFRCNESVVDLKARYKALVGERYPLTAVEAALPEVDRKGIVPPAVLAAVRRRASTHARPSENKHATPADAPSLAEDFLQHTRPVICTPSAGSRRQKTVEEERTYALSTPGTVAFQTDVEMIDQWNREYPSAAWPFAFSFPCGGPDYPRGHKRVYTTQRARGPLLENENNDLTPKPVDLSTWVAGIARRVEAQIRGDWTLIPALRNLWFRFSAVTSHLITGTYKHKSETDDEFADRLVAAVKKLNRLLVEGVYGPDRRPIAGDITKLPVACDLTRDEQSIARSVCAVTSTLSGCQEIRRQMGHIFQSVPIMHGHGLFLTISPNERHSGLTLRLSRFRQGDPLLALSKDPERRRRFATADEPSLFLQFQDGFTPANGDVVDIDMPDFDFRREILSRDPLAPVLAFRVAVRLILAALLGLRMCSKCPACTCCNSFGSNARPTGGVFGLCAALVGAVENQFLGTLHYHALVFKGLHCTRRPQSATLFL